ncbi:hypothetical protein [Campylobacter coli]|uniref:hypothetical protein n=1 Tax=Campylobacter coli TaxID=195 RepID=UPI003DA0954A
MQSEIVKTNHCDYIFSSEGLSILATRKFIESMNTILRFLGFKKIFIVCYIRDTKELCISLTAQQIKDDIDINFVNFNTSDLTSSLSQNTYDSKKIIKNYIDVFGKENLIVRLFDKNEFYQGDLFKDFVHAIGLQWSDNFTISKKKTNESLDLIGIELQKRFNKKGLGGSFYNKKSLIKTVNKYFIFTPSTDKSLKFQPSREMIQSYIDYFEESNEWIRKEFFPHKERLFPKKDLTEYKENYELKEMKPEYWDRIVEFIVDVITTKNQTIQSNLTQIKNLNQTIETKNQTIQSNLTQIKNLNQTIQDKDNLLSFQSQYGTAKSRIQNQLSYKLGQTMIVNSKNIFGILFMPVYIISTLLSYRQEKKIYQEKIKKDPSLKLPPLESYPDYKEALKEKECLTYKLGVALIRANNNWYGGGYIKLWFEIRKLKKEFKKK